MERVKPKGATRTTTMQSLSSRSLRAAKCCTWMGTHFCTMKPPGRLGGCKLFCRSHREREVAVSIWVLIMRVSSIWCYQLLAGVSRLYPTFFRSILSYSIIRFKTTINHSKNPFWCCCVLISVVTPDTYCFSTYCFFPYIYCTIKYGTKWINDHILYKQATLASDQSTVLLICCAVLCRERSCSMKM